MVHFTTSLLALSAATAAMAGSFAAPAHPAGLAQRQTNREQILRRQAHSMQRVKRQASAVPIPNGPCGTVPANFYLQFSGISAADDAAMALLNNQFGTLVRRTIDGDEYVFIEGTRELTTASVFGIDQSTTTEVCEMTENSSGRLANTVGTDNAAIYMDTRSDSEMFGQTIADCKVGESAAGQLSCVAGDGNTIRMCKVDLPDNPVFYTLYLTGTSNEVAGCTPVTVTVIPA